VLEAAELVEPDRMDPEEVFSYAQENSLLPKDAEAGQEVTLKGLSYMVMQAFGIRGGLFYTITKSQHHAYRELVQRGIIQGRADPLMYVDGDQLLFTINRALHLKETGRL